MGISKEIVTKAVIGKGKKIFRSSHKVEALELPTTVLGCWVINHSYSATINNDIVKINGSFDVNIWYAYDNDTKTSVVTKKVEYEDEVRVKIEEEKVISDEYDIIVRKLKDPSCEDIEIKDGSIVFNLVREFGVDVIGETKMMIDSIDFEEKWEEIEEESEPEEVEINEEETNTNYL